MENHDRRFVLKDGRTKSLARSRKKRDLYRFALAASDIRLAEDYCQELIQTIDWQKERIPFHLTDAFSAAVVIAYARPFIPTRDLRSVGVLPAKWYKFTQPELQATHDLMLQLRNNLFAHTDQSLTPMKIYPPGAMMRGIGHAAPRISWELGRRAIPPQTTILNFRATCHDLRERLESAVSESLDDLYGKMDLPIVSFSLRLDEGF